MAYALKNKFSTIVELYMQSELHLVKENKRICKARDKLIREYDSAY